MNRCEVESARGSHRCTLPAGHEGEHVAGQSTWFSAFDHGVADETVYSVVVVRRGDEVTVYSRSGEPVPVLVNLVRSALRRSGLPL